MTEIVSYQLAFNLAKLSLEKVLQERPKTFLSGMPLERALEYKLRVQEKIFSVEQTIHYNPEFTALLFIAKFGRDSHETEEDSEETQEEFFDVYIKLDVQFKDADIYLINTENGRKTSINHRPEDLDILIDVINQNQEEKELSTVVIHQESNKKLLAEAPEIPLKTPEEEEFEYAETPETKYFLYQLLMNKFLDEKDFVSAKKLYEEFYKNDSNSPNKPLESTQ